MSNDEIRELIQLVVESGIAELEIERGEDRVRIRRTLEPRQEIVMQAPAQGTMVETAHATPVPAPPPASERSYSKVADCRNILRFAEAGRSTVREGR